MARMVLLGAWGSMRLREAQGTTSITSESDGGGQINVCFLLLFVRFEKCILARSILSFGWLYQSQAWL